MANLTFSASVAKWAEKVPEALEAVWKQSAQDVVREMQTPRSQGGRLRVDTGFLRASLLASTSAMPSINPNAKPADGATYAYNEGQIEAVIAGAELGQKLFFGYVASYAAAREFGARGQPADAFVRLAAQNWNIHVDRNTAKVKAAFGL